MTTTPETPSDCECCGAADAPKRWPFSGACEGARLCFGCWRTLPGPTLERIVTKQRRGERRGIERAIEALAAKREVTCHSHGLSGAIETLESLREPAAVEKPPWLDCDDPKLRAALVESIDGAKPPAVEPVSKADELASAWNEGAEAVLDHVGEHGAPQSGADVDALYGRNPYGKAAVEPSGDSGEVARDVEPIARLIRAAAIGINMRIALGDKPVENVYLEEAENAAREIAALVSRPASRLPMPNAHERGCR